MKKVPYKTVLNESELPKSWYNIAADLPDKLSPCLGANGQPVDAAALSAIFSKELIEQEMSEERYIKIPREVLEKYKSYRSTPLVRAYGLEKALGTPAKIYYKFEGQAPSGSHKMNSAIPQVYYNKKAGTKRITTETGAGQWGTALSIACAMFGIECEVYMVKVSANQKPYRKAIMETYGAKVFPSPSANTECGRAILAKDPDNNGTLGTAISEAVEVAVKDPKTKYCLGSVLNHVMLHQTIIGQEALKQFQKIGDYPDVIVACHGGGSNFGGICNPFLGEVLRGENKKKIDFIAVEPSACPTLTKGKYAYDFGDTAHFTPAMLQYTLGTGFKPDSIHAGGLRYHGASQISSYVVHKGLARAVAVAQTKVFDSATLFAKTEAILPAPESAHAAHQAIIEALKCKETGESKTILFNLTGHGYFDLTAYTEYNSGKMKDVEYTEANLESGFQSIPKF